MQRNFVSVSYSPIRKDFPPPTLIPIYIFIGDTVVKEQMNVFRMLLIYVQCILPTKYMHKLKEVKALYWPRPIDKYPALPHLMLIQQLLKIR